MTAHKTAGQKKVVPATASGSPAKFTYTAPDKSPDTGSVTLESVSRRGIGIAHLEYTTALDLKIDADLSGLWHVTATKCGGPAGTWTITGSALDPASGNETISVELADRTFTGPWSSTGEVGGAGASVSIHETGIARYTAAPDGKSGTLALATSSVPVTTGKFCANGAPTGG